MSETMTKEAIRYGVIQDGVAVFGVGSTPEAAYMDAAEWMEGCTPERVWELCQEGRRQNGVYGVFVLVDETDHRFASHLESHQGFELIDGTWFAE